MKTNRMLFVVLLAVTVLCSITEARYYDPIEGRFVSKDPAGFSGGDVNLYAYVGNNPIIWVDPEGLFHYKPGVPAAGPQVETGLRCMDSCIGTDLGISGGGETSGHSAKSKHYSGQAADISFRMNPGLDTTKVMCCAKKCGFNFAQAEKDHYHVQTPTGGGGSKGQLPECGCDK
jgi:hypothetical protein